MNRYKREILEMRRETRRLRSIEMSKDTSDAILEQARQIHRKSCSFTEGNPDDYEPWDIAADMELTDEN